MYLCALKPGYQLSVIFRFGYLNTLCFGVLQAAQKQVLMGTGHINQSINL